MYMYIYIYIYIYIGLNRGGRVGYHYGFTPYPPSGPCPPQSINHQKSSQSHTRARRSRSQRHLKGSKPCVAKQAMQAWGAERPNSSSESRTPNKTPVRIPWGT